MYLKTIFCVCLISISSCMQSTSEVQKISASPARKAAKSNEYLCFQSKKQLKIDGQLNDSAWQNAEWTIPFVPIQADRETKATYETKAKLLWDETYLYIAAELKDEHLWATLKKRDSKVYKDDVFEIFIDPDGDGLNYYECQINAFATIWDLKVDKPYRDGGKANSKWTIEGLQKAVALKGTLNDAKDIDQEWTVELAIPWRVFAEGRPTEGQQWRMNMTRVDWDQVNAKGQYRKIKAPKDLWLWSPVGEKIDFHQPEKWGYVQFLK